MITAPPLSSATAPIVDHDSLPVGTRFGEFEILRVLGVGGFGIVYLAHDHSLERQVALKEYMPSSLAARGAGPIITLRSGSFAETYAIGLRSFINEARLLARFDHPSLVKVYRFWEDNATAYMVMPYLQGTTLRDARRAMMKSPDEMWIRGVLRPMLDALELLHREGVYHRDVAPDNILLPPASQPILLDFGAARHVISDRTQSLTAILKPSYAPIEQYAEMTQMRQGPWTDLYALGAVMHFLLFGQPPSPATARAVQDGNDSIEGRIVPGVSSHFMSVVAWMLAVRPHERPQSVDALRSGLDGRTTIPQRTRSDVTMPAPTTPAPAAPTAFAPFPVTQFGDPGGEPGTQVNVDLGVPAPTRIDTVRMATLELARTELVIPTASAPAWSEPPPPQMPEPVTGGSRARRKQHAVSPYRSRSPLIGAGLAVAAVLVLGAFWYVVGQRNPSAERIALPATVPAAANTGVALPAPAGSTQSAPAQATLPVVTTNPAPVPAATTVPAPVPVATTTAAPPVPARSDAVPSPRLPQQSLPMSVDAGKPGAARVGRPVPSVDDPVTAGGVPRVRSRSVPLAGTDTSPSGTGDRSTDTSDDSDASPAPAPVPAVAAGPATAREACGNRSFIALAACMDRECENPRYSGQLECVKVLATKRSREHY